MRFTTAAVLVIGLAVGIGSIAPRAAQGCGPELTPEQKARRTELIRTARDINTQQARSAQLTQKYGTLGSLTLTHPIPAGADVKMSVDADGYSFAIVDTADQCHSAVFSNAVGIIYTGQALQ